MLPLFEYHQVKDIEDAVQLLKKYESDAKIIAGGTDILLQLAHGNMKVNHLISLSKVPGLEQLKENDEYIVIGANTTHRAVELSPIVKSKLYALHEAAGQVGSVQIRNVATVAGNLCNAAPSADTATPLLVHDALLRVSGSKGERQVKLKEFYRGPGLTVLNKDEVLKEILVPKPPLRAASTYIKHARRKAMDLALIGVSVYIELDEAYQYFKDVRIALGTLAPTPIRAYQAEELLKGKPINEEFIKKSAEAAGAAASPRTSWRSTGEYRRDMANVLVFRALNKVLKRIVKSKNQEEEID